MHIYNALDVNYSINQIKNALLQYQAKKISHFSDSHYSAELFEEIQNTTNKKHNKM